MESYFNFISSLSYDGVSMAVNGLVVGMVLTGLVLLIWRFVKRVNAATSYCVWWTVLAVVIALPLAMGGATRAWFESGTDSGSARMVNVSAEPAGSMSVASDKKSETTNERSSANQTATTRHRTRAAETRQLVDSRSTNPVMSSINKEKTPSLSSLILGMLPVSLFGIWLAVVFALVTRILLAYRRIILIKRRSKPFDIGGFPRIVKLIEQSKSLRPVRVRLSSEIEFPMAAGLGSPTVLIPRRLAFQLTPAEMESVIIHELAHISRWDDWTKLGQRIAEALMFFNPAVHWIGRRLDLDREIACDDCVIEQMGRPGDYARCLTRLTQLTSVSGASLIPGVLTSRKQIFKRFEKLLDKDRRRGTRFSRSRFALAITPIVAVLVLAVSIIPAVALPIDEVSFDEFYSTVKTVAGEALPVEDVEPEFEAAESPVFAAATPLENITIDIGTMIEERAIDLSEFRSDLLIIENRLSEMDDILVAVPEVAKPIYLARGDIDDSRSASTGWARVIDWDDDLLDMQITGNIRGVEGIDDWVEVWTGDDKDIKVVCKGDVEFSRDHRSIRSISDDGFVAIRDKQGSTWRELDIEQDDREKLEYDYYVEGDLADFDDDAEEWLAGILEEAVPEILKTRKEAIRYKSRSSGISRIRDDRGLLRTFIDWTDKTVSGVADGTWSITRDSGEREIHWSEGRREMNVKLRGEIEFTDDDKSIKSISEGGYFSIYDKDGRERYELDVEPDKDGNLEYNYWVNDKSQDFDDDAIEDWLADIVYDIITKTGLGAEARAERIYRQHGVDGVLDEISSIESDYVKRIYFQAILDVAELSQDDYGEILRKVSRYIDSDYEKAELLVQMSDDVVDNRGLTADYVDAVGDIDSDYETRRVLSALSLRDPVDEEIVLAVLEIAWEMDSDYEKAELLIEMAPFCEGNEKLQAAYVDAAVGLDSDYETRRVLSDLILDERTDDSTVIAVLDIISDMDSDYEQAEMLIDISDYRRSSRKVAEAYQRAVRKLDSDYERRRVLSEMYDDDTDEESLVYVLDLADEMESDYDKAELLIDMAERSSAYERATKAYLLAASNIGSSYETKRVLLELIDSRDLNDDLVLAVLKTTESMNSDYEKSEVLKELARYCRGSDVLEDAYIDAVETLDSDYEIDKLYSKLYRRSSRSTGDGN